MPNSVLVIGGGPAGLQACSDLVSVGVEVTLVEKADFLGGNPKKYKYKTLFPNLRPASEVIDVMINRVEQNSRVKIMKSTQVTKLLGQGEDGFSLEVTRGGAKEQVRAEAIIVATGFEHFDARRDAKYCYDLFDDVIDIKDLELMLGENRLTRPSNGKAPERIGFIFCVGSRDKHIGNTYCCTVCCTVSIKQAIELKEVYPQAEIFVFYMDIRTIGFWEDIYWKSQEEYNIQYIKGRVAEISYAGDRLMVKGEDTLLRGPFEIPFDLVVLASGVEPGKGTKEIAGVLGLPLSEHGFLAPKDLHLYPFDSPKDGIFVAGCATQPRSIDETVSSGSAAAMRALAYSNRRVKV